ncbi:MAG: Peroxide-responsive repressor PerR [Candidatus Ordinivivax streblomastigis]|uniref:Peroxide-responsive repressor PerR n=1 Tax=Candidatus Ordinivivax streblomastigis TaxID=2540710 RepID=A0A5M8NX95_9BACT|nr:MAG: Peroxide-responsive repressor PerR [Candidatus Ordinivivax streblomastigis]
MDLKYQIKDRLMSAGVKPSPQRMQVLEYLTEHPVHPTVDMIFLALSPAIPTLSKTTVYNTLKLLEEQGVIQSITIDEKNVRYDANTSAHAHFKCKGCGKIEDLYSEVLNPNALEKYNYLQFTDAQVYYRGYCTECQKEFNERFSINK